MFLPRWLFSSVTGVRVEATADTDSPSYEISCICNDVEALGQWSL
jgi:hypothetical protein